jgi:4'-phosphopantetheinyl transferase
VGGAVLEEPHPTTLPVELWWIKLNHNDSRIEVFERTLNESEQMRAGRFVMKRDRARYIAGRYAMRTILSHCVQARPKDLALGLGRNDKPILLDKPNLGFNLSHTGDLAVLALVDHPQNERADAAAPPQVGVDIELSKNLIDAPGLFKHCLCKRELDCLRSLSEAEQLSMFFEIWVRKEASLKALGLGFEVEPHLFDAGIHLRDTELSPPSPGAVRIANHPTNLVLQLRDLEMPLKALTPQDSSEHDEPLCPKASSAGRLHGAVSLVNAIPVPSFQSFEFQEG